MLGVGLQGSQLFPQLAHGASHKWLNKSDKST